MKREAQCSIERPRWSAWQRVRLVALSLAIALLPAGCGENRDRPSLARVHGHVTLDGQPLAKVSVIFRPQEVGARDAMGVTDANGGYFLKYLRDDQACAGRQELRDDLQAANSRPKDGDSPSEVQPADGARARGQGGADNEINFDLASK